MATAVKRGQDHLVLRLLQAGLPLDGLDSEGVSLDSIAIFLFGNMIDIMRNRTGHQRDHQRGNLNAEVPCYEMNTRYKTVLYIILYSIQCIKLTLRNDLVRC